MLTLFELWFWVANIQLTKVFSKQNFNSFSLMALSHPHKHKNFTIISIYMNLHSRNIAKPHSAAIKCGGGEEMKTEGRKTAKKANNISDIQFWNPLSLCTQNGTGKKNLWPESKNDDFQIFPLNHLWVRFSRNNIPNFYLHGVFSLGWFI